LTNDGQFVYVWDNADRLKEVRTLDNSLVMSCRYDGLGRRRERIVAAGHEGGPATTRTGGHGGRGKDADDRVRVRKFQP